MHSRKYAMPVEPFAEIIENAIFERKVEGLEPDDVDAYKNLGMMTPLEAVTDLLARRMHVSYSTVARRVYEIRYRKVHTINFDMADAIACSLGNGVWFFLTDQRVAPIYEDMAA
jgi:hypothetical protein